MQINQLNKILRLYVDFKISSPWDSNEGYISKCVLGCLSSLFTVTPGPPCIHWFFLQFISFNPVFARTNKKMVGCWSPTHSSQSASPIRIWFGSGRA